MTMPSPLSDPSIVPDPYPVYADLAQREPVHWSEGLNAWAVMTYADCAAALKDHRLKAERMEEVLDVKFPGRPLPPDSIYHRFTKNVMMYTDPPRHDALRRSTQTGFTRAAHEHYSQVIARVAADLVASIPQGTKEIDAVSALAAELPVRSAVRAFGVPEEDLDFVIPCVDTLMTYWSGPQDQPVELDRLLELLTDLHTYAQELVEGKRGKVVPDTVIARLAAAQHQLTETTPEQTVHQLVLLFIALFAPTTPGSVSSGMLSFARNPDQIARFLADPACVDNTANEVVRYNASNQFTWRVAKTDLEAAGVRIGAGQSVALFLGAANRDPGRFERPSAFDLDRPNSAKHLSFGLGIHSCLGRQIANLQLKWFFVALFARFPGIRPAGEPIWNPNLEFRSLQSLPLRLS
ncbi:4-nitrotryptophan synthase [Streptomyces sp. NBC_01214]|uniref:4-nitrotryptophan synthase n=1 Tax=Streptomyces sp. NBC_01214 TaxID=2903777 RepID=UPI0022563F4F|nr:4-nitrotryptophan synthase [Streptomyces sp. NBC_01214]MCX4803281.1 4-nitrotryptophan synthase [Streptomyces sp. NBC_01214]